jgi:hypothetical protein
VKRGFGNAVQFLTFSCNSLDRRRWKFHRRLREDHDRQMPAWRSHGRNLNSGSKFQCRLDEFYSMILPRVRRFSRNEKTDLDQGISLLRQS